MYTIKELAARAATLSTTAKQARKIFDRYHRVDEHAQAALDQLLDRDEGLRRLTKHDRTAKPKLLADLRAERLDTRVPAAGVAAYKLSEAAALDKDLRAFVAAARRDTSRTWPTDQRADPIMLALLQETIRASRGPELRACSPTERHEAYRAAVNNPTDPRSRAIGELIEAIVASGTGASSAAGVETPDAIGSAKAAADLRRYVEFIQESRIPAEVAEIRGAIDEAKSAAIVAEALQVRAINPESQPSAVSAFEAEAADESE